MSLNNDSRFTSIIECFDLVILTNRGASNKRILATGRIALQNICTDLESLRNKIASLTQSLEALQQTHTLQDTELSTSTNKCTGLEDDIVQLRGQVQAQAQQINENATLSQSFGALQQSHTLQATELSASTKKCKGLEDDILQLRGQVQAQAQQINEKNKSIKDGVESLQKGKLLEK